MPVFNARQLHLQSLSLLALAGALSVSPCVGQQLANSELSLRVGARQDTYSVGFPDGTPIVQARTGAEVDHRWLRSSDYPRHAVKQSSFSDALGSGTELQVTCSGLSAEPDLIYSLRIYAQRPYGTIQVSLRNTT